ncbi:hypothetical protein [Methanobrevibacter sp.]|uniref:hypothetical protein n=1 Tax=Methanobrevibacter sp. TaxID=66852 RepID=UPI0025CFCEA1|nr:hypothetical protein [Methanobrevibacter sp.]MBR4448563.1 hypothetical protein [Methanobrevibacter sp.]
MENKNIIIILVAIIAVIAIAGGILASGILNGESKAPTETTPFETEFMDGSFVGKVKLANDDEAYMRSYVDKENKITYNISTVDDSDALMDIYYIQGVMNPEKRTINGNDWNIYFTQAVEGNDTASDDNTMNIIICQSQGEKQGYLIYSIFDAKSKVNGTTVYGDAYKDYIEPLLNSITLKESSDVPKINEEFGLTEDQFAQQMELIKEYKSGNTSALEGYV